MSTLLIRPAEPGDAYAVWTIYAPIVRESTISLELEEPSVADMRARIEELTRGGFAYFVAEKDGVVLGYGYAARFRPREGYGRTEEVSVYVAPAARGQGVGSALLSRLLDALFQKRCHCAMATIGLPNEASTRLFEGHGFELVGVMREVGFKFERWTDVGLWQRLLPGPDASG